VLSSRVALFLPFQGNKRGQRAANAGTERKWKTARFFGYLALATTTPDGVEAGDLVHAVDRVRQVMETGASLAEAAQALETDSQTTGDIESPFARLSRKALWERLTTRRATRITRHAQMRSASADRV